jgi:hypothetical protein
MLPRFRLRRYMLSFSQQKEAAWKFLRYLSDNKSLSPILGDGGLGAVVGVSYVDFAGFCVALCQRGCQLPNL